MKQLTAKCVCVCVNSLGEVGDVPPPSVEEELEGGLVSVTGSGTGRAMGGGGGGGSMGVVRNGLWTFPWEPPLGWGGAQVHHCVSFHFHFIFI